MSAAPAVRLVAGREVRERGRSRVFWVGTAVVLAGVAAAIVVPAVLGHHGQQTFRVGTLGAAPAGLAASVTADAAALGGKARIRAIGSAAAARSALHAQALDLVIEGPAGVLSPHQNTGPALDHQVEGMGIQRGAGGCGGSDGPETGRAAQGRGIGGDR